MNNVILKFRIKQILLDLIFYTTIFILAYLFDKWFEMCSYIVAYTIIRSEFSKAVHGKDFTESYSKGIKYCRYITFSIQLISLIFIISVDLSKYINLILAFILGIINFFAKDYLEFYVTNKIVFYKGMTEDDIPKDLVGIEKEIVLQYYIKRYKLDKIAFNVGYSVDNVKKLKAKIIKRYS
jgi:hypothetical protein